MPTVLSIGNSPAVVGFFWMAKYESNAPFPYRFTPMLVMADGYSLSASASFSASSILIRIEDTFVNFTD